MKKCFNILLLLSLLMPIMVYCQDTLKVIESYAVTGQYLNAIILADSSTWQRGNTVYVLRKGGAYAWNASITIPSSLPTARLEFRSDYGIGSDPDFYPDTHLNPIIYFYPTATGGGAPPGQMASILAQNFTFKMTDINVSCYNERSVDDTMYLRLANTMFLRTQTGSGSTTRIILDSCIIKTIAGQIIRTEGATGLIKATNCIFAEMGHPSSNFGAGKFIDARNVKVDTIWVENNTFLNMYDRVIRHLTASASNYIGNFIFNHNTLTSSMSYHGFLSLGTVNNTGGGTFQIRDNLLLDHFALGMDTANVRQGEFSDPGELDRYGRFRMAWVLTNANNNVQWDIRNNYYAVSDSGQAILDLGANPVFWGPLYRSVDLDSIGGDPNDHNFLTRNMNSVLATQGKDTLNTFRKVRISFTEYPGLMTELLRWVLNGSLDGKNKPTLNSTPVWLNNGKPDFHRHKLEYYADTLNCSYSSTTDLSTAGTDGMIIGATRWAFNGLIPVINFAAAPKTIDFGAIMRNATKTDTVIVSNSGNTTLVIDSIRSTAVEFSIIPASGSVSAGSSEKFAISYKPTTPGAKSGSILFYHNGTSKQQDTVSVSGDVVAAPTFEPTLRSVNFGSVYLSQYKIDSSITVANHGAATLEITLITSTNSVFLIAPAGGAINIDGEVKFYITFTPLAEGLQTGKIIFTSNASSSPDTITVNGTGTAVPVPVISLAPTTVNFGNVMVSTTKTDSVLVSNIGTADLNVTGISSTNARFTFDPATMTITASNSAYLHITFTPSDTLTQSGSIILTHNAAGSPDTVLVNGKGTPYVGVKVLPGIPTAFALRQNYPNPFNPSTTIQFDLPVRSDVRIVLINMLGQVLKEIVNGRYEAGYHQVEFNASNLPSGIYFYKINAGNFLMTKKMILMK